MRIDNVDGVRPETRGYDTRGIRHNDDDKAMKSIAMWPENGQRAKSHEEK